jgi:hypothetical protein
VDALAIAEYAVFQLLLGWPFFLIASVILVTYLRRRVVPWPIVLWAVALAWPFTVLVALIVWRWWPLSLLGPPMWTPFIHFPALVASIVVFPLAGKLAGDAARARKLR